MTSRKSYLSARARRREISGERKRGLDGNSVKRASIGEVDGFSLNSCSIIFSRVSMSESKPFPKK